MQYEKKSHKIKVMSSCVGTFKLRIRYSDFLIRSSQCTTYNMSIIDKKKEINKITNLLDVFI